MRQRSMNAIAGLSASFAATAHADIAFSADGPFELAGGESVQFNVGIVGTLTGLDWEFEWEFPGDSSWASDMQITVTDPNSNSVSIAGFDSPGVDTSYDGPASGPAGTYGDNLAIGGLSGAGFWTLTITNDRASDLFPNIISNLEFNFQGPGTVFPPAPGTGATAFLTIGAFSARRRRF